MDDNWTRRKFQTDANEQMAMQMDEYQRTSKNIRKPNSMGINRRQNKNTEAKDEHQNVEIIIQGTYDKNKIIRSICTRSISTS